MIDKIQGYKLNQRTRAECRNQAAIQVFSGCTLSAIVGGLMQLSSGFLARHFHGFISRAVTTELF